MSPNPSPHESHLLAGRLLQAQEAERRHLARELHDGLSQDLALLAVELDLLAQDAPGTVHSGERLQGLVSRARALSSDVHRLAHRLHPSRLERLGLAAALGSLCKEVGQAHALAIEFRAHAVPRTLPGDVALCLYRVAQEAVGNLVRHSGAGAARVELTGRPGGLCLRVADTGKGFDAASAAGQGGLGLVGMRERLSLVGGTLAVHSGPARGTRIEAHVPLLGREP